MTSPQPSIDHRYLIATYISLLLCSNRRRRGSYINPSRRCFPTQTLQTPSTSRL